MDSYDQTETRRDRSTLAFTIAIVSLCSLWFASSLYTNFRAQAEVKFRLTRECATDQDHVLIRIKGEYFCVQGRSLE